MEEKGALVSELVESRGRSLASEDVRVLDACNYSSRRKNTSTLRVITLRTLPGDKQ